MKQVLALVFLGSLLHGMPTDGTTVSGSIELAQVAEEAVMGPFEPLADSLLQEYFAERPKEFLVDPQRMLGRSQRNARSKFLNYHADDSEIDLFAFVFGEKQELPDERLIEDFLISYFQEGRPAVLVFYPFGDPSRARLILSPSLEGVVPQPEQSRALANAIQQAEEEADDNSQFESFLMQTSMRLYWMESALGVEPGVGAPAAGDAHPNRDSVTGWQPDLQQGTGLTLDSFRPWLGQLSGGAAMIVTGCAFLLWRRVRARHKFPDFSVEPRLGGAHGAGMGAVISFSSASASPASQRETGRDLLERL